MEKLDEKLCRPSLWDAGINPSCGKGQWVTEEVAECGQKQVAVSSADFWTVSDLVGANRVSYIEDLREAIEHLHGAEATHVSSVPVKETFQGKTVWEGIVEVFDLHDHPTASIVYAWTHKTDNPDRPRHVTVLHVEPVTSPELAVRASIIQELKNLGTGEAE
jgi:hypothetical protein